jgi:hypothetical protein
MARDERASARSRFSRSVQTKARATRRNSSRARCANRWQHIPRDRSGAVWQETAAGKHTICAIGPHVWCKPASHWSTAVTADFCDVGAEREPLVWGIENHPRCFWFSAPFGYAEICKLVQRAFSFPQLCEPQCARPSSLRAMTFGFRGNPCGYWPYPSA